MSSRWPILVLYISVLGWAGQGSAQEKPRIRPSYDQGRSVAPNGPSSRQTTQPTVQGPVPSGPPQGFQLRPDEQARIDRMLKFWENKTAGIKTFRTNFTRWQYDPVFGPKLHAIKITGGEMRYAAPDKGMVKETKVAMFDAAKQAAGEKWPYTIHQEQVGEHWVCDGTSVFEINHQTKQLIETKLPPQMQGNAIAEGPLPFMFGAKAATIRERYWIREIPQKKEGDPFHLEFIPKGRGANYSRVRVQLDPQEFLPQILEVHDLNNMGRSVYRFDDRHVNAVADNVKAFWDVFVRPSTPPGFKKVEIDASQMQPLQQASRDDAAAK